MSMPVSELMACDEQLGVLVGVVEIGDGRAHVGRAASLEVGGHGGEFLRIARDEEELRALRGPDAAGGFGDAGGGAKHEDLLGELAAVGGGWIRCGRYVCGRCGEGAHSVELAPVESVTRSQKLEVSMGSRKRAKRCHSG